MSVRSTILPCLALLACLSPATRAEEAPGEALRDATPAPSLAPSDRVLELFTSHGCSSCPRADRLLGELLERDPSLIGLEYHVDYWNSLVHGAAGNFVDPFSDSAWSLRQRDYDGLALAGRGGVYTPQAIVDGRHVAVGSDAARIERALAEGRGGAAANGTSDGQVDGEGGVPGLLVERDGEALVVRVSGVTRGERDARTRGHLAAPVPDTGEVALVHFLRETRTPITGGENRGLELVNHRVVTRVEPLGAVDANGALDVRTTVDDDPATGCAVLVRYGDDVSRLAGRLCPDPA